VTEAKMKWARLWAITAIVVSLPPVLAMEKQEVEAKKESHHVTACE
jgi:hypothetical protein